MWRWTIALPRHGVRHVLALSILCSLTSCGWFGESTYSNCAFAADETHFTGLWLRNDGRVAMARRLTKDCKQVDVEIDGGDGKRVGRVRWAECLKGPDCDEAGMF